MKPFMLRQNKMLPRSLAYRVEYAGVIFGVPDGYFRFCLTRNSTHVVVRHEAAAYIYSKRQLRQLLRDDVLVGLWQVSKKECELNGT